MRSLLHSDKFFSVLIRVFFSGGLVMLSLVICPPVHAAYEQEVAVELPEVFHAVLRVFEPYGTRKADMEQGVIESDWISDTVVRKDPWLGSFFKKTFMRRSRVRIDFKSWPTYTILKISSDLQYKREDASKQAAWRVMKPGKDHGEVERDIFRRILLQMEAARNANPALT